MNTPQGILGVFSRSGEGNAMAVPEESAIGSTLFDQEAARKRVLNRLKRAHGQLGAVIAAVESNADCRTVVTQLSAVSAAVERAGFAVVASGMKRCLSQGDAGAAEASGGDEDGRDTGSSHRASSLDEMEKLFMMLT
ncbi:MAG: metal-sensitive transcriptional regulator [Propionibacteriaceae bacterium]|nr:metal-sensitive transcriptional regulator [Propionibacteriaceae bacterium]